MLGAGLHVFAVWPWVLANCDRTGRVEINPRLLAFTLGTEPGRVEDALDYLMAPDPHSRTDEAGGVRLERVGEFDYQIVNYEKYRKIRSAEDRRAYKREWMAARRAGGGGQVWTGVDTVDSGGQCRPIVEAEVEAEAEAEAIGSIVAAKAAPARSPRRDDVDRVVSHFCECYRQVRPASRTADLGPKARKVILQGVRRWGADAICEAITSGAERARLKGGSDAKYFRASTIFRNEANLERLIEAAEESAPGQARADAAAAFFGGRFDD